MWYYTNFLSRKYVRKYKKASGFRPINPSTPSSSRLGLFGCHPGPSRCSQAPILAPGQRSRPPGCDAWHMQVSQGTIQTCPPSVVRCPGLCVPPLCCALGRSPSPVKAAPPELDATPGFFVEKTGFIFHIKFLVVTLQEHP